MGKGTLTIYSASAGSGKTFRLTGIYLSDLFRSRYNYRKILAVTFTNKATSEMKSRILDNLDRLANGKSSEYLSDLMNETQRSESWIRAEAREILNSILHDFSRFSVSTIDSFFQKILRAFARDIGIHSGFNIELDHSVILSSAVDKTISSASRDEKLLSWLTDYARSNIDDEKNWNLKNAALMLSEELFREKFKILSLEDRSKLEDKEFLNAYIRKIKSIVYSFENKMLGYGKRCMEIYSVSGLSDDMFFQKSKGIPSYIKALEKGVFKDPGNIVREIFNDPPRWSKGTINPLLQSAIDSGLENTLKEVIRFHDSNILNYKSANAILLNIYSLGILSDVLFNIHQITTSENTFLLTDAGELLNLIIGHDQTSFIYEKVGTRYENFMIDEFQDTSVIQWKNFEPLINNSMAEGSDNLVVGDIKQSIYRWRNSDWKILASMLTNIVDNERFISKQLTTNWRSRPAIIGFNNSIFSVIPHLIDNKNDDAKSTIDFCKIYEDAIQNDPGKKDGGYIRIGFVGDDDKSTWEEKVLEMLPGIIESVQDNGYEPSDIGIIVRESRQGAMVLKKLTDYKNSLTEDKKVRYNFEAVSNDSLLLSNSPVLNFIISVISVINNPDDDINRALMLRLYLLAKGDKDSDNVILLKSRLREVSEKYFPVGYLSFLEKLKTMPLYEATENIIFFFDLGKYSWNVTYLNTFQDYVLGFSGSHNSDFQSFLDWWSLTGSRKSVVLPGNQEAMRILTIHKSKGLEFKIVILPFLSWNLDHTSFKQPVLWLRPSVEPFNEIGIVPVKYSRELINTIFAENYYEEKKSAYIDNINLLYVALTRAKDAIYGFSSLKTNENNIASMLMEAITYEGNEIKSEILLHNYFKAEQNLFEYGNLPTNISETHTRNELSLCSYNVNHKTDILRLKLHGNEYFLPENDNDRKNINYGILMHEVFENIKTIDDISESVKKMVLEGRLSVEESDDIENKIKDHIETSNVYEWFSPKNKILNEAAILLPSGNIRRPDRVIFRDGKTIVLDLKFGEENTKYAGQIKEYCQLITEMGYTNIEAYIWYVNKNLIVPVYGRN
jgi:ATP-dependent helicase/nuclease subunit A